MVCSNWLWQDSSRSSANLPLTQLIIIIAIPTITLEEHNPGGRYGLVEKQCSVRSMAIIRARIVSEMKIWVMIGGIERCWTCYLVG